MTFFHPKAINSVDASVGNVFVIRAEGVVSYRVATQLLAVKAGEGGPSMMVRVSLSDTSMAQEFLNKGAQVVPFHWTKPETFAPSLLGIKTVFCTLPHLPDGAERFHEFVMACKAAGVKNFVKLSFAHALNSQADTMKGFAMANDKQDPYLKVPLIRMHRECDEHLIRVARGAFNYTILFASHFMSNPAVYQSASIRQDHVFYGASHGKPVNYVSPNDVADVAVCALLHPKNHHNVGYKLVGPNAVTDEQVATYFGEKLGLEIKYVDQENETVFAQKIGAPDWGVSEDVVFLEKLKATGIEAKEASHDIDKVCGHQAETFPEYLAAQQTMSPLELSSFQAPGLTA